MSTPLLWSPRAHGVWIQSICCLRVGATKQTSPFRAMASTAELATVVATWRFTVTLQSRTAKMWGPDVGTMRQALKISSTIKSSCGILPWPFRLHIKIRAYREHIMIITPFGAVWDMSLSTVIGQIIVFLPFQMTVQKTRRLILDPRSTIVRSSYGKETWSSAWQTLDAISTTYW